MASQHPIASLPIPDHFTHLAVDYSRQTANTTYSIFADLLQTAIQTSKNPIASASIVHDNAAGPGTATAALFASLPAKDVPQTILVSDNNPAMVSAARDSFKSHPQVETRTLDSHDLSSLAEGHYSHSIINFSIFTFPDPAKAVAEVFRSLQPGGTAVITCWRRFPVGEMVRAAQALVRPDLPLMPVLGARLFEETVLEGVVVQGGFAKDKMEVHRQHVIVSDEEGIEGLRGFMASTTNPFIKMARKGYSEEEEGRWPAAVGAVIRDEVKRHGGVRFEAFAVIATK